MVSKPPNSCMKVCLENTFRGIKDESSLLFTLNDIFSKYYYLCNVYIITLVILKKVLKRVSYPWCRKCRCAYILFRRFFKLLNLEKLNKVFVRAKYKTVLWSKINIIQGNEKREKKLFSDCLKLQYKIEISPIFYSSLCHWRIR